MLKRLISSDAISTTGVHISTGIILESLIEKDKKDKYDIYMFNIYTLIKN